MPGEDLELYCQMCGSTFVEECEDQLEQEQQFRFGVIPASSERNTPEIRFFSAVVDEHKVPEMIK